MKKIKCRICNREFKMITPQHLEKHGTDLLHYRAQYPDAPLISEETRIKSGNRGEDHHNWKGGISNNYNSYIMFRDKNTCQLCGSNENLCSHLIDYRLSNSPRNRIALCRNCLAKSRSRKHRVEIRDKLKKIAKKSESRHERLRRKKIKKLRRLEREKERYSFY